MLDGAHIPDNFVEAEKTLGLACDLVDVGIWAEKFSDTRGMTDLFEKYADATIFKDGVRAPRLEKGLYVHPQCSMAVAIEKLEEWVPDAFKNEPGSPLNVVFLCLGMQPSDGPVGDHVIYADPNVPPAKVLGYAYELVKLDPEI